MIVSGLDWSGDPSDPKKAPGSNHRFVVAVTHVEREQLSDLDEAPKALQHELRLPDRYCFKNLNAARRIRLGFFQATSALPITAHVRLIDKTAWNPSYLRQSTGPDQICDAIVNVACGCPNAVVAGPVLLVDAHRGEPRFVRQTRSVLRRALLGTDRQTFQKIGLCPNHRTDGATIQVANMIAGEILER